MLFVLSADAQVRFNYYYNNQRNLRTPNRAIMNQYRRNNLQRRYTPPANNIKLNKLFIIRKRNALPQKFKCHLPPFPLTLK